MSLELKKDCKVRAVGSHEHGYPHHAVQRAAGALRRDNDACDQCRNQRRQRGVLSGHAGQGADHLCEGQIRSPWLHQDDCAAATWITKALKSIRVARGGIVIRSTLPTAEWARGPRVWNDRAGEVGRTLNVKDFDLDRIFGQEGVQNHASFRPDRRARPRPVPSALNWRAPLKSTAPRSRLTSTIAQRSGKGAKRNSGISLPRSPALRTSLWATRRISNSASA